MVIITVIELLNTLPIQHILKGSEANNKREEEEGKRKKCKTGNNAMLFKRANRKRKKKRIVGCAKKKKLLCGAVEACAHKRFRWRGEGKKTKARELSTFCFFLFALSLSLQQCKLSDLHLVAVCGLQNRSLAENAGDVHLVQLLLAEQQLRQLDVLLPAFSQNLLGVQVGRLH